MQKSIRLYRMSANRGESGKDALEVYVIAADNSQLEKAMQLYESQGYRVQFDCVAYIGGSPALVDMRDLDTHDSGRGFVVIPRSER